LHVIAVTVLVSVTTQLPARVSSVRYNCCNYYDVRSWYLEHQLGTVQCAKFMSRRGVTSANATFSAVRLVPFRHARLQQRV
jgi:hypothetical protein